MKADITIELTVNDTVKREWEGNFMTHCCGNGYIYYMYVQYCIDCIDCLSLSNLQAYVRMHDTYMFFSLWPTHTHTIISQ